jgi:hypothetical protein
MFNRRHTRARAPALAALVLAAAAGLSLAAVTAAVPMMAASAATTPVKVYASDAGWHSPSVKPAGFIFGQGGSPFITGLRWQWWSNTAYATGRLWAVIPGCAPLYLCKYYPHWISVRLSTIRLHGSVRYFSAMTVKFWHNGAWHRQPAHFRSFCGACTVPFWIGPASWPYL